MLEEAKPHLHAHDFSQLKKDGASELTRTGPSQNFLFNSHSLTWSFSPYLKNFSPTIIFFPKKESCCKDWRKEAYSAPTGKARQRHSKCEVGEKQQSDTIIWCDCPKCTQALDCKMYIKIPSCFTVRNFSVLPFTISGKMIDKLHLTARKTSRTECKSKHVFLN